MCLVPIIPRHQLREIMPDAIHNGKTVVRAYALLPKFHSQSGDHPNKTKFLGAMPYIIGK